MLADLDRGKVGLLVGSLIDIGMCRLSSCLLGQRVSLSYLVALGYEEKDLLVAFKFRSAPNEWM